MALCHFIIAIIFAKNEDQWPTHKAAGWGAVVMVWLFVIHFGYCTSFLVYGIPVVGKYNIKVLTHFTSLGTLCLDFVSIMGKNKTPIIEVTNTSSPQGC